MLKRFEAFVTGISTCYKSIQKIKSAEMNKFGIGLKGTHMMCIFFLHMNPDGLTASHLSKLCSEDKAAISRAVATLQQEGYVSSHEKKYRDMLHLTKSGEELALKLDTLISQWVSTGGDGLTQEERDIFYKALGKIAGNLTE